MSELITVKLLIEAGSQIVAESNTSRGSKLDVLIETGSLIQAGYTIEAWCHLMTLLKTS